MASNMGLTSWSEASKGGAIRKADVGVAKNYLNEQELGSLNRIVNAYIEIAELQVQAGRPMSMCDWIARLDDFLRMAEREVLGHAGKVAAEVAQVRAHRDRTRPSGPALWNQARSFWFCGSSGDSMRMVARLRWPRISISISVPTAACAAAM